MVFCDHVVFESDEGGIEESLKGNFIVNKVKQILQVLNHLDNDLKIPLR